MVHEVDEARATILRELRLAEGRQETAGDALDETRQARDDVQSELKLIEQQIADIDQQLKAAQADGKDVAQREAQLDEAALAWRGEKALLEKRTAELANLGDDPHGAFETLQGQRNSLLDQATTANENLIRAETQLQSIINEAPYSALAEVEEQIERLEQDIAREQLSYNAIRLLHNTFVEQTRQAHEAVIEPVQQRANRTLQRIAGGTFQHIAFDESLLPTGVQPLVADDVIALDYLSGGEQEQVHFAVRLALADVAFGDQRQLLVLDDAFTATDTARLARVIKILEETAERFQVLLLSCHPERYRHLKNVQFFDLTQLTAANAGEAT